MDWLNSLFGGAMSTGIQLVIVTIALVLALLLIFWLFRKIAGTGKLPGSRKRQPRLAVTDAAVVDDKRRLILVRRDNVEHLMMIGGPTDVVVESNVQRTQTATAASVAAEPIPDPLPITQETPTSRVEEPSAPSTASQVAAVGTAAVATVATGTVAGLSSAGETVSQTAESVTETIADTAAPVVETSVDAIETAVDSFTPTEPVEEASAADLEDAFASLEAQEAPVAETPEVAEPTVQDSIIEEPAADDSSLAQAPIDVEAPEPAPEPETTPEVAHEEVAPESPPENAPTETTENPEVAQSEPDEAEDEMQRLLRELSGEKTS